MYALAEASLEDTDGEAREALQNRIACGLIGLGLVMTHSSVSRREGRRGVRDIMRDPVYRSAVKQLRIKAMPIHWKLFFLFAKWNCTGGVCLLLRAIHYLKGRV
jgi:glycosyltransferase EpsH